MKRLLLLTAIMLVLPGGVFAQMIGLFADTGGNDCNLVDNAPGPFSVHVVLINHGGAAVCEFQVLGSRGFAGTHLSDTPVLGNPVGDSQNGIFINLMGCRTAPTHVLTINYNGFGLSSLCSTLEVIENGNALPPTPSITDCVGTRSLAFVKAMIVNPTASCTCAVPVEETTWGRIKSIYSRE